MDDLDCDCDCDCDLGDCGLCDSDCACCSCDIPEDCFQGCCEWCFSQDNQNAFILNNDYGHNNKNQNDGCRWWWWCCDGSDIPNRRKETKMPSKVKNDAKERKLKPHQEKSRCCPCSEQPNSNEPEISPVSSPFDPPICQNFEALDREKYIRQRFEALDREKYAGQHKHSFPYRPY